MDIFQLRLKKAPANFQLLELDAWPTWDELTSTIFQLFQIPRDQVIITFRNPHGAFIDITNVGDLRRLYESLQESCRYIKFVVQDSRALDATLSATWSANSNLSDLKPESLVCWVLNSPDEPFSVPFQLDAIVDDLKETVKHIMDYTFPHPKLRLWKLTPSIPSSRYTEQLAHFQRPEDIPDCIHLPSAAAVSDYFLSAPKGYVHIIVQLPTTPVEVERRSKKQKPDADDYKSKREKTWHILGPISSTAITQTYFLDPAQQSQNQTIIDFVNKGHFLLIAGARASGKTTRLFWLSNVLQGLGYRCFYFTVELLSTRNGTADFWSSISVELDAAGLPNRVSSPATFNRAFIKSEWKQPVVILIDEMSQMSQAPDEVVDSFLGALRGVRHKEESAIQSVIAAGTFGVIRLSSKNPSISPFNVAGTVQMPYFNLEETRYLFNSFQRDYSISIESDVIKDIWAKSNGHPGMVCLCGTVVLNNLMSLLSGARALSFSNWQKFPITKLYNEILAYNTFRRMLISLRDEKSRDAVQLYRSRFAGFLEDVEIAPGQEDLADFLTGEGVLLRPVASELKYRTTSPLTDALVRLQVIPSHFPNMPLTPVRETRGDVLAILVEALKCFDKNLIKSAYDHSFKFSKVYVNGSLRAQVPRESVYDTELMRILCNWLRTSKWSVTGQLHMITDDRRHKYSDIVIQSPDDKPIVFELVATGEPSFLEAHIKKTPEYMTLSSAVEGWVVHFTCEDSFIPTWQTDAELSGGVNVIHISHTEDFTNLKLYIRSKNWKEEYDLSI